MTAPAVYRNPRYEAAFARQAAQIAALYEALGWYEAALRSLRDLIDPETHIPALPEVRDRAFGMGH